MHEVGESSLLRRCGCGFAAAAAGETGGRTDKLTDATSMLYAFRYKCGQRKNSEWTTDGSE